jgi:hypothetical protein
MKKIIILLIAAYIGLFAWEIYRKTEYNKYRGDQNWQYFKKVIFARDIDKSPLSLTYNLLRWASDIKIKTEIFRAGLF